MNFDPYKNYLNKYSRQLKKEMTKAECWLWKYALKNGQRQQVKFRKQRPIGDYIVDFVSIELKLVIEVDGITHSYAEVTLRDQDKDKYLSSMGYKIVRFSDEEILTSINRVIASIDDVIEELRRNRKVG